MRHHLLRLAFLMMLSACKTPTTPQDASAVKATASEMETKSTYLEKIQPLFDKKCVACHSCNQSPCQVNLGSYDGLRRGGKAINVYAKRLTDLEPMRLFVDASSEAEWRGKGFYPITDGVLWQMLEMKKAAPDKQVTKAAEAVLLELSMCTAKKHGMPYGMPALSTDEAADIRAWLDEGAKGPSASELKAMNEPKSPATVAQIQQWEAFLNGDSPKQKLLSRYLYEHLFLAHLYFADEKDGFAAGAEDEFYRLVRTKTKDGPVTEESHARHPYDDADLGGAFYYRFRKIAETIVHKTHIPYPINDRRMARIKELFVEPEWTVSEQPPYGAPGSNPFRTFAAIPVWARYQFLLDDAAYFTRTDIRGPVCSGQMALNVIQDLGWRLFLKPEADVSITAPEFFATKDDKGREVFDLLHLPAETQVSTLASAQEALVKGFLVHEKSYVAVKDKLHATYKQKIGLEDLWDGDGNAHHGLKHGRKAYPGALQTIVRNYDSADILPGLLGNLPKTAELFDYPLMERTYYNLVTGFDVYASLIDGLNIRAYKDAMRVESEDAFLKLAPHQHRNTVREYWYSAKTAVARQALKQWMKLWNPLYPTPSAARDTTDVYEGLKADATGREVSETVMRRVAQHFRDKGLVKPTVAGNDPEIFKAFEAMKQDGAFPRYFPEVSFLRIGDGGDDDLAYSILANRFRTNTKFVFAEIVTEVPENDKLMVVDEPFGSFPNLFFKLTRAQVPEFTAAIEAIKSQADFDAFRKKWAVGRNDADLWSVADWFYQQARKRQPIEAARYDLARYDLFYR